MIGGKSNMNITEEIYDKHPLVWNELKQKYHEKYLSPDIKIALDRNGRIDFLTASHWHDIPFNMLSGLLIDFFDSYRIYIDIKALRQSQTTFEYRIHKKYDYGFKSRKEALEQAFLRACEILEEKLK
jgi:hypothetical protein